MLLKLVLQGKQVAFAVAEGVVAPEDVIFFFFSPALSLLSLWG